MQKSSVFFKEDNFVVLGGWTLCLSISFFRLSTALSSILYAMSILCVLIYCFIKQHWWLEQKYWIPIVVFAILSVPSLCVSDFPPKTWKWVLDCFIYRPMGFVVPLMLLRNDDKFVKKILLFTLAVFCVEGGWALYEFLGGIEYRSDGFGGPILTFGCCATIFSSIFIVLALDDSFNMKERTFGVMGVVCSWCALLANGSRSCWIMAFGIMILLSTKYILTSTKKIIAFLVGIVILVGVIFTNSYLYERFDSILHSGAQNSVYSRMAVWDVSVRMANDHPFTGVGMRSFENHYDNYYVKEYDGHKNIEYLNVHAHSNYFHMLAEGGYPALIGFVFLLGYYFFWNLLKLRKNFNPYRMMILGVLMAFASCGAFEYTWKFPGSIRTMWYFLGILTVLAENYEVEKCE